MLRMLQVCPVGAICFALSHDLIEFLGKPNMCWVCFQEGNQSRVAEALCFSVFVSCRNKFCLCKLLCAFQSAT